MTMRVWGTLFLLLTSILPLTAQSESPILLLTEVFYDAPGLDEEREWVEIANLGTAVFDLSDIKLGDEETAGGGEGMRRFPEGAQIEPGQVIVIAQTAIGFQELYGRSPDYEIIDSDPNVPDMRGFPLWATGDFGLSNDGDEVMLVDGFAVIDTISYGDSQHAFTPAISSTLTGQSIERIPANCDSDTAADWQAQSTPTPGQITLNGECVIPINPSELEELPPIGAIQGNGRISPFINRTVSFRGVVTGVYEDRNAEGTIFYTLFVQDLIGLEDGDPATSDGIAVFLGQKRPSYHPGDQLRITGLVTEFFDYTEIENEGLEIILEANGTPLPVPIPITPPKDERSRYFEPLESMLVTLDGDTRVVGPTYSGCGFTVVQADSGLTRLFRRRASDPIGPIITVLHESDVNCGRFPNVKVGDGVNGISGPLIYNFDEYKIVQQETDELVVTAVPLPNLPTLPTPNINQFSIASFNVENHFDNLDDTGDAAEPKPTSEEIAAKQTKLAYAIGHLLGCPTLIGIQEVEKASLLVDLADEVEAICGFTYVVTHHESADIRGIDLALLSDPRQITVINSALRQGCTHINTEIDDETAVCAVGKQPLFSRPPLLVNVTVNDMAYSIIVNHFKSKRGGESETASRRLAQAQHIVDLVNELRAHDEQARVIVMGDFNDYEQAPPLTLMTTHGGLTNTLLQLPDGDRYSFVFGGASQLIDGILITENLLNDVTAVTILHTNADFPDSLGTDTAANLDYKATDHDLPMIMLNVAAPESVVSTPKKTEAPTVTSPTQLNENENQKGNRPNWLLWFIGILAIGGTAILITLFRRQQ